MAQPSLGPKWEEFKNTMWPNESHGINADCPNPYCDYMITPQDVEHAEHTGGAFECPKCRWQYDLSPYLWGDNRERTRSGMSLQSMGQLGEDVVKKFVDENGGIPGLGELLWESPDYHDPIDIVAGDYALEVKSLHSESFPRYKIAADPGSGARRADVIQKKHQRLAELSQHLEKPLYPGLLGVRLNFYTNRADLFFAPEYKDRMMTAMQPVGYTDFSNLNPFPNPEDVTSMQLPPQGETSEEFPF